MKNDKKIAFIICTNDELMYSECINYLQFLVVPKGYIVDVIAVKDAKSMLLGMEEGCLLSDAKFKIYMHQDVVILNRYFLQNIIDIFLLDSNIGLIGMVGSQKIPADGVMWHGKLVGNLYDKKYKGQTELNYQWKEEDGLFDVEAVDGFMLVTAYDIPFQKEIFDGWDFYDVSTSIEYRKRGYRIVVPKQHTPWCLHDDGGILSLWNYDLYRRKCLEYYDL